MSEFVSRILTPGANISLHTLPLALLLAALPHWYTISLCLKHNINGGWDNRNPRAYVATLQGKLSQGKKLSKLEEKILRGQSCQANAFENIGLFAATLLVGNFARLGASTMNGFAIFYLVSRVIYTLLYLNTETKPASFLRTIAFNSAVLHAVYIWLAAGNKIAL